MMPHIVAVASAVPGHRVSQAEVRATVARAFATWPEAPRYLPIFDHAGVATRHLAFPLDYYLAGHTFEARNRDAVAASIALGEAAAHECLKRAGYPPEQIRTLVYSTTTVIATPSVDALLVQRLPFSKDVVRLPLFGIGCAGGTAALARAAERAPALVLSIELCSPTFVAGDHTPTNMVGAALFGDGGAAALILPEGPGPRIEASMTRLFPDSQHIMGWDVRDVGLKLILSTDVPAMVKRHLKPMLEEFLRAQRLGLCDVDHWILHPGGPRVLEAYAEALGLGEAQLAPTRSFLRENGNLSSASVLFVLESIRANPGDFGVMVAVGPGFAAELVLLRW